MPHVDLLELPYFHGISTDALVSLVDLMEPRCFAPGEYLFEESDPLPPPLYIITTGNVFITKHGEDKRERTLAELESPTLIGEIELFCQIPPVSGARAGTTATSFMLTRPHFEELFRAQHPAIMQFTFNVARVACHRLAIADEVMAELVEGDALVRIRRTAYARLRDEYRWAETTGAFSRKGPES